MWYIEKGKEPPASFAARQKVGWPPIRSPYPKVGWPPLYPLDAPTSTSIEAKSTRRYNRHMARFHPNKEINDVIEHAVSLGWRYTLSSGHAHGQLWCPRADRGGCRWSVWSTPRNSVKHARWLRRQIESCPHRGG